MERNTGHTDGRCENIDVEGAVSFSVNIRKDEKKKKKKKNWKLCWWYGKWSVVGLGRM